MMNYLFYILSVWGFTHILVSSKILEGFRNWSLITVPFVGEMLGCYQCTSFWSSIILYFLFEIPLKTIEILVFGIRISPDFLIWAFIGSGLCSIISSVFSLLIVKARK